MNINYSLENFKNLFHGKFMKRVSKMYTIETLLPPNYFKDRAVFNTNLNLIKNKKMPFGAAKQTKGKREVVYVLHK